MSDLTVRFNNVRRDGIFHSSAISCPFGTRVKTLLENFKDLPAELAAVRINNEILPLSTRLEVNSTIEPVLLNSPDGVMIYRRSLAFLLAIAGRELFPERSIYVGHSLGNCYYYTFGDEKKPVPEDIEQIKETMKRLVDEDLAIHFRYMAYEEALELFRKNQQTDTALLLDHRSESKVQVNECNGYVDLYIEPLVNRTGLLSAFDLVAYKDGFLLRFPGFGQKEIEPFEDSPRIFSVYNEYKKWGRIVGVHSVGQLNRMVSERTIKEYINIAEAFQSKKLAEIADRIYENRESVKVILIAGPSSSGKTTTAKRLSIQLKVMGIEPIAVGLDDYYLGPESTPKDENG
ncbi:nucleoside kinase, partial [Treponema sp. OttesenSCG-928-L16]|nr:nucleoside kinase [Treponema sp. OttesenSCG-928-L16]